MQKVVHFPKTNVTPSEVSFFPTNSPKPNYIIFIIIQNREKQKKLETGTFLKGQTNKQELIFSK